MSILLLFAHVADSGGTSLTIEEVATQLQEVTTLKTHVADQTGLVEAVRAIKNLATAQVPKHTSNHIGVEGLWQAEGEFIGKEEDFWQWLR